MDLAVKTPPSEFVAQETQDAATDSQTLRNQQLDLQNELSERMISGDAAGVLRIQNLLRELPVRIRAAEIAELRQNIDDCTARIVELKDETDFVESLKGEQNRILAEKIKAVEEAGLAVERVNLILYQLDAESENNLEARREYNRRLNKLIADAQQEFTHSNNT